METSRSRLPELVIDYVSPTPLYGGLPFPKDAKKCKRCKMPSELQFCMICQFEFVMMAKLSFESVMVAISSHQQNVLYDQQRDAYRAAKKRMKHVSGLKSYGVTFEETRMYRKRLKTLRKWLKLKKERYRMEQEIQTLEQSMSQTDSEQPMLK